MAAYKYTLKNGKTKWYSNFYYKDWTGSQQHKCKRGFDTKKDAQLFERNFLAKECNDPDIRFKELAEDYLEDIEPRIKPSTYHLKQHIIHKNIIPYFAQMKVSEITPAVVRKWHSELLSYCSTKGKPYSQTYLKNMNNQLSSIFNYATRFYNLPVNPCTIAGSIGKNRADEMHIWTLDEFNTFIQFEESEPFRLAYELLYYSGLREGEFLALTPNDILLEKAAISVNKTYMVIKGKEYTLTPKTPKSRRIVTIPASLYAETIKYVKEHRIQPEERIFMITKSQLLNEFHDVTKKAGLPQIRIHDLRHSHAALLIQMDRNIKEISARLGHESVKTTLDIYAHMYPGTDDELAGSLDNLRTTDID